MNEFACESKRTHARTHTDTHIYIYICEELAVVEFLQRNFFFLLVTVQQSQARIYTHKPLYICPGAFPSSRPRVFSPSLACLLACRSAFSLTKFTGERERREEGEGKNIKANPASQLSFSRVFLCTRVTTHESRQRSHKYPGRAVLSLLDQSWLAELLVCKFLSTDLKQIKGKEGEERRDNKATALTSPEDEWRQADE